MGKKDKKKGKGAEKTAAKTDKKLNSKLKKELALKGEDDIETLLAKCAAEDKKKTSIKEDMVKPPSKRYSFSLTTHPDKDQLILFGGEYFNGDKTFMYNDLFFYHIKQNRWIKVTSPDGPPPRSSHQAVAVSQCGGQLWIFGGEFTSPTQSQFYHYKDLWVFHFATKRWEKVVGTGSPPTSRSGHRMVQVKKCLFVFGGFHDTLRDYQYFNDVYCFSLEKFSWSSIDAVGNIPKPRSACQMLTVSDGRMLIYGGYSKERVKKDVDRGVTHTDMFLLVPDKHDTTFTKFKWQQIKQNVGVRPAPRCAFSMTSIGIDKAVLFGGVFDEEDDEEMEGLFYNDLYQLDLAKQTWHEVILTGKRNNVLTDKKRRRKEKGDSAEKDDDDDEASVDEELSEMKMEEVIENVTSDDGIFTVTIGPSNSHQTSNKDGDGSPDGNNIFIPPPRINPGLCCKKGVLYLYGGMYEDGDRQLTLNDFYSIDVSKCEEWNTIIALNKEDLEWFDSDSESEEDEDDTEESDDEMSEEDKGDKDTNQSMEIE